MGFGAQSRSMYSVGDQRVQQNLKLFLSLDQHYTQNLATSNSLADPELSLVDGLLMDGWPIVFPLST